jgi:repressor LexA
MQALTERQQRIYDFLGDFHRQHGLPPTVYEVAEHFAIKPSTAFAHLRALQRKGYLQRTSKARSLTLLKTAPPAPVRALVSIPLLGRISAGLPLLSEQQERELVQFDAALLPRTSASQPLFALRINGESMRDAGIRDGDLIVARAQPTAEPGEIVIALVDGESTIKYYHPRRGRIELRPANPAFASRFYAPAEVQLQGVMTALLRTC